jgi:hypothetical protein
LGARYLTRYRRIGRLAAARPRFGLLNALRNSPVAAALSAASGWLGFLERETKPSVSYLIALKTMSINPSNTSNALNRDHARASESLRLINRELLVATMSDIPEFVKHECDKARDSMISAIQLLAPLDNDATTLVSELPVADFNRSIERHAQKFAPLFNIGQSTQALDETK